MKEIIDSLKKYTDEKKNTEKVEISVLQLNRIIKALEQEPCGDAISRDEVLNSMAHAWNYIVSVVRKERPSVAEEAVYRDMVRCVEYADTIIEADMESEDKE